MEADFCFDPKYNESEVIRSGMWEVESYIDCAYPSTFNHLYKHSGTKDAILTTIDLARDAEDMFGETGNTFHRRDSAK